MRLLITSTFYPPVAFGGYENECAAVVERLQRTHEVLVLTGDAGGPGTDRDAVVWRRLPILTPDARGALRAPAASLRAVGVARAALDWRPDLIYAWNGAGIPQAALRVLADSGLPFAVRVCEHWFGRLFTGDQFLRELLPAPRSLGRQVWSGGCRLFNRQPSLRLAPTAPLRMAISWNSVAIDRMVDTPSFVEPVLERTLHSVPRSGDRFEQVRRAPGPDPEIVFLGRVAPQKGVQVAIEALGMLRDGPAPSATLTVIGPEDVGHGNMLRGVARRLGVTDAVRWLGPQPPDAVASVLGRAHALIVPSIWDEPFPLVTIEAALARVPIVAADVGGISEGMHDEEHALLFARGDAASAAAALARILHEPDATAARVRRAFARAQDFRIGPYLDAQEKFVLDAYSSLTGTR